MNALKIYSRNYLDENCSITCSSGDGLKAYLYDQNQDTQWSSSGSDDATEETLEITFKNWQGVEATRTFDRIILLNHNIKAGDVDYWDGSAWVEIAAAAMSDLSTAYKYIELSASVSASRVRLRLNTAQVVNAEKTIGELKFCLAVLDGTQLWLSSMPRADEKLSGIERTGGGRLLHWKEWTRFAASGTISDVSKADRDLLMPYLKGSEFITVVFCEDFDPAECFECAVVNAPSSNLDRKTQRYEIALELTEI